MLISIAQISVEPAVTQNCVPLLHTYISIAQVYLNANRHLSHKKMQKH